MQSKHGGEAVGRCVVIDAFANIMLLVCLIHSANPNWRRDSACQCPLKISHARWLFNKFRSQLWILGATGAGEYLLLYCAVLDAVTGSIVLDRNECTSTSDRYAIGMIVRGNSNSAAVESHSQLNLSSLNYKVYEPPSMEAASRVADDTLCEPPAQT